MAPIESLLEPGHLDITVSTLVRRRVLVVDDDRMIRSMLRRLLSMHQVIPADGGQAALELCQNEDFDIILCDVMMPKQTGLDVYHALRAKRPELARRIIFMTGGVFDRDVTDFLDSVDNPCLVKPMTRKALLEVIARVLDDNAT